jgi:uncharacterized protein (TIGR03435 family)
VSQADLKAWQNQNPKTHDLLHSALRAALKERFKLAVQEEPAQRTIFELVVAKARTQVETDGSRRDPSRWRESGERGVMTGIGPRGADGWKFHGATMQDLADMMLQVFFDGLVRDRTGLTGRQDFQVPRVETPGENRG